MLEDAALSSRSSLPLGRPSSNPHTRTSSLLCPIPRLAGRQRLALDESALPFFGEDRWMSYELSWLDARGKPQISGLELRVPCASPNMVESKSLKLYLNSLAMDRFTDRSAVRRVLMADLSALLATAIRVELVDLDESPVALDRLPGHSLDALPVEISEYQRNPLLLRCTDGGATVSETWHTHLFRSLCPVTGQPDWGSVMVAYQGVAIEPNALLAYLVSYRCHAALHEDVIEQVFLDIQAQCRPVQLTVSGHFLRRGGIDINPLRSTEKNARSRRRLARQ